MGTRKGGIGLFACFRTGGVLKVERARLRRRFATILDDARSCEKGIKKLKKRGDRGEQWWWEDGE